MNTATLSPLDRLAQLAAQRTARTDRLVAATHALLARLDKVTEAGDSATVDGHTLQRRTFRTNVGWYDGWFFEGSDMGCYMNLDVNEAKYVHGDFDCEIFGPTRRELIAFALLAPNLVTSLCEKLERHVKTLEKTAGILETAATSLPR